MKVGFRDNNLIVFLCNKEIANVDFFDSIGLEKYFRELFLKLNNYGYEFNGSYNITVFIDDFYGVVLEIENDEQDYYDFYDSIDMNISVSKYKGFLYKLDYFINNIEGRYFFYNGSIYFEPKSVNFIDLGILIENSDIIYGKKCFDIRKAGNILVHE